MLYLLGHLLKLENLTSIYFRSAIAFIIGFVVLIRAGKPFISYLKRKKIGDDIREEGPKTHFSKQGTPTMGGVLLLFAIFMTGIITFNWTNKFTWLLVTCSLLFGAIGFIDDFKKFTESKKGLSGKKKILGQVLISLIVWFFIIKFGLIGNDIDFSFVNPFRANSYLFVGKIIMLIFIMFLLTATSNSVNITDGLDGLVIMPVIIVSAVLGSIAYFTGHIELSSHLNLYYIAGAGEIAVFLSALIGAGLGFLWYNSYPAQIFMGDTGSLTLGGILGIIAILLKQEFLFPIIGFVFLMEAISVILQVSSYKMRQKRIFKMAPIHHHFELKGLPETKVTMRFWIVSLIFGIIGLLIIKLR